MFEDINTAKEVNELLLECRINLSKSVDIVIERCNATEAEQYKKSVGKVLGYMILDLMEPIYKKHPELNPINDD